MVDAANSSKTEIRDLDQVSGEFSFTVDGPLGEHRVRFWGDVPENPAGPPAEAALAVALLPAMAASSDISLPGPFSPQLRRALPDLQAVLKHIATESELESRQLHRIDVREPEIDMRSDGTPGERAAGVGAFFSGGVDSWQAVLANPDVTDPIYVHGFDIPIDRPEVNSVVESRLTKAVAKQGRSLRVVRTNLRELTDGNAAWEIAHGPAMAAVALLLAPDCGRTLIPSTNTYAEPSARGSQPLLDHLWGTERCRIEHYGAFLSRPSKIEQVAECQDALDTLRVCWKQVERYNCCECEKCLRTMVALEAIGALDRCPAFPAPLDLDAIASLRFHDPELPIFWRENLALARRQSAGTALCKAIESCLTAFEMQPDKNPPGRDASLAEIRLQEVVSSRSWRMTAPLRRLGAYLRRIGSD